MLQTSDVAGAHPAPPVLELLATDSALNAGRAASQTKVADNKGTPKGQVSKFVAHFILSVVLTMV